MQLPSLFDPYSRSYTSTAIPESAPASAPLKTRRIESPLPPQEKISDAVALEKTKPKKWGFWRYVGEILLMPWAKLIGYIQYLTPYRYPVTYYRAEVDAKKLWRGSRIESLSDFDKTRAQSGMRSVVSLCKEKNKSGEWAKQRGLNFLNVGVMDNSVPTIEQAFQFVAFASDPKNQPVYVHCQAGKGRTGIAVACYRMAAQGWTLEQALAEAEHYKLHLLNQRAFLRRFARALQSRSVEYPA